MKLLLLLLMPAAAEEKLDIPYRRGANLDAYAAERCKLDLYLPAGRKDFPTLVWFHGGGLENGGKGSVRELARSLAADGLAVAAVDYRLSPKARYPAYLEDAAAATAWVLKHIAEQGGNPKRVLVGGHSAGGWLTLMLALDERWLKAEGVAAADLAGCIPVSGQTVTHSTVRKERGLAPQAVIADEAAPLRFVRSDAPPLLLIAAEQDMAARLEENQLLQANLKSAGCRTSRLLVVPDRDHGTIAGRIVRPEDPARRAILELAGLKGP